MRKLMDVLREDALNILKHTVVFDKHQTNCQMYTL